MLPTGLLLSLADLRTVQVQVRLHVGVQIAERDVARGSRDVVHGGVALAVVGDEAIRRRRGVDQLRVRLELDLAVDDLDVVAAVVAFRADEEPALLVRARELTDLGVLREERRPGELVELAVVDELRDGRGRVATDVARVEHGQHEHAVDQRHLQARRGRAHDVELPAADGRETALLAGREDVRVVLRTEHVALGVEVLGGEVHRELLEPRVGQQLGVAGDEARVGRLVAHDGVDVPADVLVALREDLGVVALRKGLELGVADLGHVDLDAIVAPVVLGDEAHPGDVAGLEPPLANGCGGTDERHHQDLGRTGTAGLVRVHGVSNAPFSRESLRMSPTDVSDDSAKLPGMGNSAVGGRIQTKAFFVK